MLGFTLMDFLGIYRQKHRHPANRFFHSIGIPAIVVSLPLFFCNWRWASALFLLGWLLQFLGHVFEGNSPAFFSNPIYLIIGPYWWLKKTLKGDPR